MNTTLVIVAVIIIIIVGVVAPIYPKTSQVNVPTIYTESYQAQVPVQIISTETASVFSFTAQTVKPETYVYESAQLNVGQAVSVSWSADSSVDVYIVDSSQFSTYQGGGGLNNPIATQSAQNGTLGFQVTFADTYTMIFFNPHNGILGIGSHNLGIYSASGTAVFQTEATQYQTTEVTSLSSGQTNSTTRCNLNLIEYPFGYC